MAVKIETGTAEHRRPRPGWVPVVMLLLLPWVLPVASCVSPIELSGRHGVYLGHFRGNVGLWVDRTRDPSGARVVFMPPTAPGVSFVRMESPITSFHLSIAVAPGVVWEMALW